MALATLASMTVRLGIDTDQLSAGADRAKGILGGLGKAVAGLGIGVPAAAAVTAGVGGMAAAFASAGAAAQAFKLAVGPQMQAVSDVAALAADAEKAAAAGAEDAADKQKAYNDALAQLPPATQAMAKEFIGLKKDQKEWSDSLADTTMPLFTKGLQIVRRLLPLLTPFVKAAAGAFREFLDEIDKNTKGNGLEKFAESMAKVAGQNLKSLLSGLKNIAVGIGGVIKAFLPLSDEMSGGFEESTAAFARWGQSLGESEGFAEFVALAKQGAQTLGTLAQAALKLLVALAPLIGLTAVVAMHLAEIINSLPPDAVSALAFAVLGAVAAFKAFSAAATAVDAASDLMDSRLGQVARRWLATAATSIKAGARMAASAVANAARTAGAWAAAALRATATWLVSMLRIAAVTIRQFVVMAARAVIWAATMAAQWLIAMGPIGWIILAVAGLVALIIAYWDEIKQWTLAAWDWIVGKLIWAKDMMISAFMNFTLIGLIIKHWDTIKNKTSDAWNALVGWIKAIPGRLYQAFLNWTLLGLIIKHWSAIKTATVSKAGEMLTWVKGLPRRIGEAVGNLGSLLYGKGRDIVLGLWNGIQSMGSWLRSTLIGWAKNMIPGPIADALGISSPSKLMGDAIGRWLPPGIVEGAEAQVPAMNKALAGLVDVPGLTAVNRTRGSQTTPAAQPAAMTVRLDGTADPFMTWLKEHIRIEYGGDVTNLNSGR
jgi:hypothetical protein